MSSFNQAVSLAEGQRSVAMTYPKRKQGTKETSQSIRKNAFSTKVNSEYKELKYQLNRQVLQKVEKGENIDQIVEQLDQFVCNLVGRNESLRTVYRNHVINPLIQNLSIFNPIHALIIDENISEILVNGPKQIYCKRDEEILLTDITFRDNEHVLEWIEKVIRPTGRKMDKNNPTIDVNLANGFRVSAVVPPIALNGPTVTIRKVINE